MRSRCMMDGGGCEKLVRCADRRSFLLELCFRMILSVHHFPKTFWWCDNFAYSDATALSEAEAAGLDAVLYDFITESHVICTADGATFADYEEVDDVTPENYSRLIRELNIRDFGRVVGP